MNQSIHDYGIPCTGRLIKRSVLDHILKLPLRGVVFGVQCIHGMTESTRHRVMGEGCDI